VGESKGSSTHVVIWCEAQDFAVVLAKRNGYYILKTAFCEIKPHRKATFKAELAVFIKAKKD